MQLDIENLVRFKAQPDAPHEIRYNCPYCDDTKGRLWANTQKLQWVCFHCGSGGSFAHRDVLGGDTPILLGEQKAKTFSWKTHPDIRGTGLHYLKAHNIDPDVAFSHGVRSGKEDIQSRIVFPVREVNGKATTVFKVAHACVPNMLPKSLCSGTKIPLILEGGTGPRSVRTAVIVEGPGDAFRMYTAAHRNQKWLNCTAVVSLFGKFLSEDQCFTLARRFDRFYILLDREAGRITRSGETASALRAMTMLNAIALGNVARHIWTAEKTKAGIRANDPGELSDYDAGSILNQACDRT